MTYEICAFYYWKPQRRRRHWLAAATLASLALAAVPAAATGYNETSGDLSNQYCADFGHVWRWRQFHRRDDGRIGGQRHRPRLFHLHACSGPGADGDHGTRRHDQHRGPRSAESEIVHRTGTGWIRDKPGRAGCRRPSRLHPLWPEPDRHRYSRQCCGARAPRASRRRSARELIPGGSRRRILAPPITPSISWFGPSRNRQAGR